MYKKETPINSHSMYCKYWYMTASGKGWQGGGWEIKKVGGGGSEGQADETTHDKDKTALPIVKIRTYNVLITFTK